MASGDTLITFIPGNYLPPSWFWVAFTSGSTEPTAGTRIYGDTSAADAYVEIISLESGTWGGGDAAGYMLLSNDAGAAWTSGENFTGGADTVANHGTLTGTPATAFGTHAKLNNTPVISLDDTVNEIVLFSGIIPQSYAATTGITVHVIMATAAATGDVSVKGFWRSFTDDTDNLLVTSFNGWSSPITNSAIDAPSVIGETTYDTLAFTDGAQMDSAAAGEFFQFLLMRDAQDGTNDDHSGDAHIVAVELRET